MNLKIILGNNSKYYRYKKKITQERLAETLYGAANYIGKSEWSQHYPSLEKIECFADVLQVKAFEFYLERDFIVLPARVDMKL